MNRLIEENRQELERVAAAIGCGASSCSAPPLAPASTLRRATWIFW